MNRSVRQPGPRGAADRGRPPSRRAFLGGAAVTVGLPFLEALAPRRAQAATAKRLVCWFVPNGVWRPTWFPQGTGPGYTLSPSLEPLAKVKSKVTVFSGLQNDATRDGLTATHALGPVGSYTCVLGKKAPVSVGPSVDQVYAQHLGEATRIPSLQLGITDRSFSDMGYPAVYSACISWKSATQPLRATIRPEAAFDQIFAGARPDLSAAERARRQALETSILDHVVGEARALAPKIGAADQQKLDEYLTGIREVEQQIKRVESAPSCGSGARPSGTPTLVPDHARLMSDLTVIALQCDATRVVSHMLGNGGSVGFASFPWLNVSIDHHGASHHGNRPQMIEHLKKIDRWEVEQFAYLLEKMDAVDEGGGRTMLDNSVVFVSSEIGDGDAHDQKDKPILVAGTAGGALRPGSHIRFNGEPQAELFVTLLNALDVPATTFGAQGKRPLPGLR